MWFGNQSFGDGASAPDFRVAIVGVQVKADSSNDFIQFTRVSSFIRQRVHAASTTAEGQTRKTKFYEKLEFKTRQLFRRFFQYFTWIFCCGDSLCERSLARCTSFSGVHFRFLRVLREPAG